VQEATRSGILPRILPSRTNSSAWILKRGPEEANDEKFIAKMSFSIYIYGFAIALFIFYCGNLLLHLLGITYG
jgi:hypothetical protein